MEMANIGGDLYTLVFHAVFWWLVFIIIERTPKGYFEKLFQSKKDLEKQKNLEDPLDLDEDVVEEEKRVQETCQES